MVKEHNIKLTINNESRFEMTKVGDWFDSGRLADTYNWPQTIAEGDKAVTLCYESDWSLAGCSGYVQYSMNGTDVTIAFSNPAVGTNKLGVGTNGKSVYEGMSDGDYKQFSIRCKVGDSAVYFNCQCSGGDTNVATVTVHDD